jgi:phosphoglycerate dehydrogenase-like enzyme
MKKYRIAVLDDYQNVALESADWSVLRDRADITVFQDHLADRDAVIERLLSFDIVCVMRERSPLPRSVIERLPNLKLIASTGSGNASIDVAAGGDHGITVVHSGYRSVSISGSRPNGVGHEWDEKWRTDNACNESGNIYWL